MRNRQNNAEDCNNVSLDDGEATLRLREVQNSSVISRRGVLWRAGLATAAGAAALTALDEQRAQAATGGNFILGQSNTADTGTSLAGTSGATTGISLLFNLDGSANVTRAALYATGPPGGSAVEAHASSGSALSGTGSASATGVAGSSASGTGVAGSSASGVGVVGSSTSNDAVHGTATADGKTGVLGQDTSSNGGNGVYGSSSKGVGVRAASSGGTALSVSGKTHFSRSGAGTINAGSSSRTVTVAGMTATSLVLVTLQTQAGGTYVSSAVPASGKFTVHLNKKAPRKIKFAWFVLAG